jgi:hypothetical protein
MWTKVVQLPIVQLLANTLKRRIVRRIIWEGDLENGETTQFNCNGVIDITVQLLFSLDSGWKKCWETTATEIDDESDFDA